MKQWTGIPVSIGIAPTKTLAKIANHMAKADSSSGGVVDLTQRSLQDYENLARQHLKKLEGATLVSSKEA